MSGGLEEGVDGAHAGAVVIPLVRRVAAGRRAGSAPGVNVPTARWGGWGADDGPTVQELFAAAPVVGARRVTLLAIQVLTELDLAQQANVALLPVSEATIRLARPSTPFEQATLARDAGGLFAAEQERLGVRALGTLLLELLNKRLFLEDSVPDANGRFGGAPLQRRADMPVLNGVHRGLTGIAQRCAGSALAPYERAGEAAEDLVKLVRVVQRLIVARRPPPPVVACHWPRPARAATPQTLPKVLVHV